MLVLPSIFGSIWHVRLTTNVVSIQNTLTPKHCHIGREEESDKANVKQERETSETREINTQKIGRYSHSSQTDDEKACSDRRGWKQPKHYNDVKQIFLICIQISNDPSPSFYSKVTGWINWLTLISNLFLWQSIASYFASFPFVSRKYLSLWICCILSSNGNG